MKGSGASSSVAAATYVPPPPTFVIEDGIRLEDEDHVRRLLGIGVSCRYWTGQDSGMVATLSTFFASVIEWSPLS